MSSIVMGSYELKEKLEASRRQAIAEQCEAERQIESYLAEANKPRKFLFITYKSGVDPWNFHLMRNRMLVATLDDRIADIERLQKMCGMVSLITITEKDFDLL